MTATKQAIPTLTEFLLARIAEDEAVARAVPEGEPKSGTAVFTSLVEPTGTVEMSPARVLAECEAKRWIAAEVSGWQHETVEDCWYSCAATYGTDVENACCDDGREGRGCDCGLDRRVALILGPLASVYADHPDFREEWRA